MVCVFRNSLVKAFLKGYEIIVIILNLTSIIIYSHNLLCSIIISYTKPHLTSIIIYSPHQCALIEHHYQVTIVRLEMKYNKIEVYNSTTEYLRKYNKLNNCYNECRTLTTSVIDKQ